LDFTLYLIGIHSIKAEILSFYPIPHFVIRFAQVFQIHRGDMDYLLVLALSIFTKIKSLMVYACSFKVYVILCKEDL
jgi:hypothetical protein